MTTPPLPPPALRPPVPRLPSRKTGAILVAAMLALGIATGASIGADPATSLAGGARAAALGRVLALLALDSARSSDSEPLLSSGVTSALGGAQPMPSPTSEASSRGAGGGAEQSGAASASSHHTITASHSHSASSRSPGSPTSAVAPAAKGQGAREGEVEKPAAPLPPIADAWVIELPYGTSLENVLRQRAAAPYLDGRLKTQGTALSAYTPLAAGQLAGAATLLSGQVGASVTTLTPPSCTAGGSGFPGAPGAQDAPGATATTGTGTSAGAGSAPCPAGEPDGVQAADAFLRETVPNILASAAYKEHGLIAIVFTASGSQANAAAPATNAGEGASAYPAGAVSTTLGAASATGVLLLSPFLSHAGGRVTAAFNPQAPRESLARLLTTPRH